MEGQRLSIVESAHEEGAFVVEFLSSGFVSVQLEENVASIGNVDERVGRVDLIQDVRDLGVVG